MSHHYQSYTNIWQESGAKSVGIHTVSSQIKQETTLTFYGFSLKYLAAHTHTHHWCTEWNVDNTYNSAQCQYQLFLQEMIVGLSVIYAVLNVKQSSIFKTTLLNVVQFVFSLSIIRERATCSAIVVLPVPV
jgi:hypothetical protein